MRRSARSPRRARVSRILSPNRQAPLRSAPGGRRHLSLSSAERRLRVLVRIVAFPVTSAPSHSSSDVGAQGRKPFAAPLALSPRKEAGHRHRRTSDANDPTTDMSARLEAAIALAFVCDLRLSTLLALSPDGLASRYPSQGSVRLRRGRDAARHRCALELPCRGASCFGGVPKTKCGMISRTGPGLGRHPVADSAPPLPLLRPSAQSRAISVRSDDGATLSAAIPSDRKPHFFNRAHAGRTASPSLDRASCLCSSHQVAGPAVPMNMLTPAGDAYKPRQSAPDKLSSAS
jgi:hypothetical protein